METDNPNQQIPPQAPPPKPPSHSKTFIIILGVMLILIMGIVSYVLGIRKNQTAIQSQQITASPTISQPSPTSTLDETTNWKTYTNQKLKYSIKYPENIGIFSNYGIPYDTSVESSLIRFSKKEDFEKDFRQITILEIVARGSTGSDTEKAFYNECPKPCYEKTELVKINNAVGVKEYQGHNQYDYYLTNVNKSIPVVRVFLAPIDGESEETKQAFIKMIYTFKFIN